MFIAQHVNTTNGMVNCVFLNILQWYKQKSWYYYTGKDTLRGRLISGSVRNTKHNHVMSYSFVSSVLVTSVFEI